MPPIPAEEEEACLASHHISRRELDVVWRRFCRLREQGMGADDEEGGVGAGLAMGGGQTTDASVAGHDRIPFRVALEMPEIVANPFGPRILEVFSGDGSGHLRFADLVNLVSTLKYSSDPEVKMVWLFALWDFDGDDRIGPDDLKTGILLVTNASAVFDTTIGDVKIRRSEKKDTLNNDELDMVCREVAREVDAAGRGITFHDFRGVLKRSPDFHEHFSLHFVA